MSRLSCRQRLNRLRLHRTYTMAELSAVLGVHSRTVQNWHKGGLMPIHEQDRPMLFEGVVVRDYLKERQRSRRCRLKPNECYCLRCRVGVSPAYRTVEIEVTNRRVGKAALAVIVRAKCSVCSATVVRFASTKSIADTPWWPKLRQADKRLSGTSTPSLKTDLKQG